MIILSSRTTNFTLQFISGVHEGAFRYIETLLNRPLSWVCCLLHFVELPFGHLMTLHVGKTTGPETRAGELGETLKNLPSNQREMVNFKPIKGLIPEEIDEELLTNQDQRYFHTLFVGIQKGPRYLKAIWGLNPPLPSKPHHARWLNDAATAGREYIQNENPPEELIRIVHIIVNWYTHGQSRI